jgi:hypothetical protein
LRETHTLPCELIEVRGADNFLSVRAEVTVAQIVGQNENDIGPRSNGPYEARGKQKRDEDTNEAWRNIHGVKLSEDSGAVAGNGFDDDVTAPPTGADPRVAIFSRTFIRAAQRSGKFTALHAPTAHVL